MLQGGHERSTEIPRGTPPTHRRNTGPVGFPHDVGQQHTEGTPSLTAPLAQQTREYGPAPTATFPAWAWGDSGATANYPQPLLRPQPP